MKKNEQIKFHHQRRMVKSDSQKLEDKNKIIEANKIKKEAKKNKSIKYVTDSIDVLFYGSSLRGTYYTSQALKPLMREGVDASLNGKKLHSR